jgi:hypothetical protein
MSAINEAGVFRRRGLLQRFRRAARHLLNQARDFATRRRRARSRGLPPAQMALHRTAGIGSESSALRVSQKGKGKYSAPHAPKRTGKKHGRGGDHPKPL